MKRFNSIFALASAFFILICSIALMSNAVAQDALSIDDRGIDNRDIADRLASRSEKGDWDIALGAGVLLSPKFSGSNDVEVLPVPYIDITWRDLLFLNNENGAGIWLLQNEEEWDEGGLDYALGVSINYDFDSRSFGKNPAFAGLTDTDGTVEAKLLASVGIGFVDLEFEAAQAISSSGYDGLRLTLGAGVGMPLGRRSFVEVTPFATWANAKYMRTLYGVTPAEAANSTFPAFRPGSGFERAGVELEFIHQFTDHIGLYVAAEYSRLLDGAGKSPFIETRDQFEVISAVFYRF